MNDFISLRFLLKVVLENYLQYLPVQTYRR